MASRRQRKLRIKLDTNYKDAGYLILDNKLQDVFQKINDYFQNDSIENLHSLRISIRRFRYVMEIFNDCYPRKLFKTVYESAKALQDVIGEGRDLDVLELKVKDIENEIKARIPKYFFKKIEKEKISIKQNIKLELIKFINDKDVNKFFHN